VTHLARGPVRLLPYVTAHHGAQRRCAAFLNIAGAVTAQCCLPLHRTAVPRLQYALTRYQQAIQSRNTDFPIKFNGQMFVATMPEEGTLNADYRDWGAANW